MAKSSGAIEQKSHEDNAKFEKRISDKYDSLYTTHGQALEDIFALLPQDTCLKFKAEIETNVDRNISDIVIDFFLKEGIPFKNIQNASADEEHKDGAVAAAVAKPDPHSAEIKKYVEDSLKNYASIVELRFMPESAKEAKILQFKDKNEAIKALTSALQDLHKAQNEFKSILVSEKEINELLKSKAAEKVIEKVSAHYNNDTVSQMLEVSKYLENKAELVKQIINSEHIQAAITLEALNSESKLSLDWVRGAMDSPAALKKFVTKAQMEAQTVATECDLCKPRFNELQTKVTEVFETQKYGEILPNLINQISPSKHQAILRAGADSIKSSVFEAIKYLAKNGSIKPVDNTAQYKTNEARIEDSAGRICEQLQKFSAKAQARILERTAEEMVITSNPLTLFKLTINPDRKRGFNHFMEEFNKACAVEEKIYPENVLKKPVELNDDAKAHTIRIAKNV